LVVGEKELFWVMYVMVVTATPLTSAYSCQTRRIIGMQFGGGHGFSDRNQIVEAIHELNGDGARDAGVLRLRCARFSAAYNSIRRQTRHGGFSGKKKLQALRGRRLVWD